MSVRAIGLKDLYVAPVTVNTALAYTAGTPVKICNAVSAKITEKNSSEMFYDDDKMGGLVPGVATFSVEFEGDMLSPASRALIFGKTLIKGMLVSNVNDVVPEVAFGYRAKNSDGKYEFRWLYVGKFDQGIIDSHETVADKAKIQTSGTITGDFYSRAKDNNIDVMINETSLLATDTQAKTAILAWFGAVPEPFTVGTTSTTITVVNGKSAIVTNVTGTVLTVASASTVALLKTALSVDNGNGTFIVYLTTAKTSLPLDTSTVANTMVVGVTAGDGVTVNTYTIVTV